MDILYGEKFDIHSLSDLMVIMSSDPDDIDILEQAIEGLLIDKRTTRKDILACQRILHKIKAKAIVESIVDDIDDPQGIDNGNVDMVLEAIEENSRKIEKILKRNNITLFDVLVEVSKRKLQNSDERWFTLPNKYGFTVLIAYIEGKTHNTETFF